MGAAGDAGLSVGTTADTPQAVARRREWGVDFLVAGTDVGYLAAGSGQFFDRFGSGSQPSE